MAKINGTLIILDVDGSPVAHNITATLNITRDISDADDKDSAPWADHLDETGILGWSIDLDGNGDWSEEGNIETFYDLIVQRQAVPVIFGPEGSGHVNFTGDASTNDLSAEGANEQTATFSGSMTGKGELSKLITS